jgi:hypothetical protein
VCIGGGGGGAGAAPPRSIDCAKYHNPSADAAAGEPQTFWYMYARYGWSYDLHTMSLIDPTLQYMAPLPAGAGAVGAAIAFSPLDTSNDVFFDTYNPWTIGTRPGRRTYAMAWQAGGMDVAELDTVTCEDVNRAFSLGVTANAMYSGNVHVVEAHNGDIFLMELVYVEPNINSPAYGPLSFQIRLVRPVVSP